MVFRSVRIFMTCCSSTAIALNTLLSPIIIFNKNKDIGLYRYLLLSYTSVAFFYSVITLITLPIYSTNHYGWFFYTNTDYFSQDVGAWLLFAFGACFILLTIIIVYSFSYRYAVLCRPSLFVWFHQPKRVFLLVFVAFIVTIFIQIFVAVYFQPSAELTALLTLDFHDANVNLSHAPYIGVPMFMADGSFYPPTLVTMGLWGTLMLTTSTIIILIIIKMNQHFRNGAQEGDFSPRIYKLQKKLFFLLILQTLVPVLFSFAPTLLGYGLGYLRFNGAEFSQFYSSLLPVAQVIDPILIFSFVRDYRLFLLKLVCPAKKSTLPVVIPQISAFMNTTSIIVPTSST